LRDERETKANDSTVFFIDDVHVYIQWEGMHPRDKTVSEVVDREEQP
jgi:hypothetical protein